MSRSNVPPVEGRIVGYKFIRKDGRGVWNGRFRYEMPKRRGAGKWMRSGRSAEICMAGFHIEWPQHATEIAGWATSYETILVKVELGGEFDQGGGKRTHRFCRVLKILGVFDENLNEEQDLKLTRKLIREDKAKN